MAFSLAVAKMKMLLFIVFFFALSIVQSQLFLPNVFQRPSIFLADRLHLSHNESVLDQMLRNQPGSSLLASRPHHHLLSLLSRNRADIHQCYDASVGSGQQIDIFNLDVFSVVQRFFQFNEQNKNLDGDDRLTQKRLKHFLHNMRFVAKLVLECLQQPPEERTRWGLTSMSALSREEYLQISAQSIPLFRRPSHLHSSSRLNRHPRCSLKPENRQERQLPPRFSWLDQGFRAPVRNQGTTAWCSVFAGVSALEYAYQIQQSAGGRGVSPREFSQKAIGSCAAGSLNSGVYVEEVLDFVRQRGVSLYEHGPFDFTNSNCMHYQPYANFRLHDYCFHHSPNSNSGRRSAAESSMLTEEQLLLMVYRNGPSVVAINSNSNPKFPYFRGERWTEHCDSDRYDHAVLLVGWTEEDLILQNSWGDWFGVGGFFHLPRGQNKCGVQHLIGSVILAD